MAKERDFEDVLFCERQFFLQQNNVLSFIRQIAPNGVFGAFSALLGKLLARRTIF
ncbi:MAG: hypothetical protein KIS77_13985 [Saprospiraceae bacterium]|nr:hypothetical protein [Saprospiraceae bacterium]